MLKIINKSLIFCFVVLFCNIASGSVMAAESGGGQVSSKSHISFYSDEPEKEKPIPTPKPKPSNLPQAGEAIKRYWLVGLVMVISVVILFVRKRRRRGYEK